LPDEEQWDAMDADNPASLERAGSEGRVIEKIDATLTRGAGVVAVLVTALVVFDVLRSGWSPARGLAAAVAVLIGVIFEMVLVRPRLTAYERVLKVHNIASDLSIPWHLIEGAEARQTLRIYTGDDVVHAVGVSKSTRQVLRDGKAMGASAPMLGSLTGTPTVALGSRAGKFTRPSWHEQVAERVMVLAAEQSEDSLARPQVVRRWAVAELSVLAITVAAVVALFLTR
jgi:hypothetical protein